MKVLVATQQTQSQREGDFFRADEGELVRFADSCDRMGCECHMSMRGLLTGGATTTVRVVDRPDFAPENLYKLFVEAATADGTLEGFDGEEEWAWEVVGELIAIADRFPAGAVVERVGDDFQIRCC